MSEMENKEMKKCDRGLAPRKSRCVKFCKLSTYVYVNYREQENRTGNVKYTRVMKFENLKRVEQFQQPSLNPLNF